MVRQDQLRGSVRWVESMSEIFEVVVLLVKLCRVDVNSLYDAIRVVVFRDHCVCCFKLS